MNLYSEYLFMVIKKHPTNQRKKIILIGGSKFGLIKNHPIKNLVGLFTDSKTTSKIKISFTLKGLIL
tara:strand:- start:63 stop:263 length:201 start_codon:yes stop_codon:yes gene_type:complete